MFLFLSCTINVATFTNRFVYGQYTVEQDNGELLTYVAPVIVVPLDIIFSAEIKFDSKLDVHKGLQKVIETFYKVNTFKVMYNGMIIQVSASFPEDHEIAQTYEFSFGDDTVPYLRFSIAVETYLPIIDHTREMKKTNVIESFTIKSAPNVKQFPTYEVPQGQNYISKTAFITDDTVTPNVPPIIEKVKQIFPEPVSVTGPYDPGLPGETPRNTILTDKNADGSIGIPGTSEYINSYGYSNKQATATYYENAKSIQPIQPNIDNNLNAVDKFGKPNSQLPS